MLAVKLVTAICIISLSVVIINGQFAGSANNIIIKTDSNYAILASLATQTGVSTNQSLSNSILSTDASGRLVVTLAPTDVLPAYNVNFYQKLTMTMGQHEIIQIGDGATIVGNGTTSFSSGGNSIFTGFASVFNIHIGVTPLTTGVVSFGVGTPFFSPPVVLCSNEDSVNPVRAHSTTSLVTLEGTWIENDDIHCIAIGW